MMEVYYWEADTGEGEFQAASDEAAIRHAKTTYGEGLLIIYKEIVEDGHKKLEVIYDFAEEA